MDFECMDCNELMTKAEKIRDFLNTQLNDEGKIELEALLEIERELTIREKC